MTSRLLLSVAGVALCLSAAACNDQTGPTTAAHAEGAGAVRSDGVDPAASASTSPVSAHLPSTKALCALLDNASITDLGYTPDNSPDRWSKGQGRTGTLCWRGTFGGELRLNVTDLAAVADAMPDAMPGAALTSADEVRNFPDVYDLGSLSTVSLGDEAYRAVSADSASVRVRVGDIILSAELDKPDAGAATESAAVPTTQALTLAVRMYALTTGEPEPDAPTVGPSIDQQGTGMPADCELATGTVPGSFEVHRLGTVRSDLLDGVRCVGVVDGGDLSVLEYTNEDVAHRVADPDLFAADGWVVTTPPETPSDLDDVFEVDAPAEWGTGAQMLVFRHGRYVVTYNGLTYNMAAAAAATSDWLDSL